MSKFGPESEARTWVHDIRNRMNALRLCSSALVVSDGNDEALELLVDIERAAERISLLTEHIPDELAFEESAEPSAMARPQ